jgi:hypothetical protein
LWHSFPVDQCTAPNKPTAPAAVANASPYWVRVAFFFALISLRNCLQPQHFRQKWTWLSAQRYVTFCNDIRAVSYSATLCSEPNGKQLGYLLGPTDGWPREWLGLTDNENGGKTLHFRQGRLISSTYQSSPFIVYGGIFTLWDKLGALKSGFGYPLADPQFLPDGSVCSVFEGGHIHQVGNKEAEM